MIARTAAQKTGGGKKTPSAISQRLGARRRKRGRFMGDPPLISRRLRPLRVLSAQGVPIPGRTIPQRREPGKRSPSLFFSAAEGRAGAPTDLCRPEGFLTG